MARQRTPERRKTRTREHILGDLAVNHVERQVLLAGFTMESIRHDYGLDEIIFPFNANGELQKGVIFLQVKGTEKTDPLLTDLVIPYRVDRGHLVAWLEEASPVILTLYDASANLAYWVYIQRYFQSLPNFDLFSVGQTVTIHLPTSQIVTPIAVGLFAEYLRNVQNQVPGEIRHV